MKTIVLLVIVLWNPSVIMQKPGRRDLIIVVKNSLPIKFVINTILFCNNFFIAGPILCVIIQDKQGLTVPFSEWNSSAC